MKQNLNILLSIIMILIPMVLPSRANAAVDLAAQLSGRILLQVEAQGKAWYVDPVSRTRAYLGRPADAFQAMRFFGLGITDADLFKIPHSTSPAVSNSPLANRLSGRILLQTQQNGEAWYINPLNKKRYFLGRPQDAFNLMRNLGLGILNSNLASIRVHVRFPDTAAVQPPAMEPPTVRVPATVQVAIANFAFSPPTIRIKAMDTVRWTNTDFIAHTVTPASATPQIFGSGFINQGQSYSFQFTKAGTYEYFCTVHPLAKGTVIVE